MLRIGLITLFLAVTSFVFAQDDGLQQNKLPASDTAALLAKCGSDGCYTNSAGFDLKSPTAKGKSYEEIVRMHLGTSAVAPGTQSDEDDQQK